MESFRDAAAPHPAGDVAIVGRLWDFSPQGITGFDQKPECQ
jgi:hypothetical protein